MFKKKRSSSPYIPLEKRNKGLTDIEFIPDPKPKDKSFEEEEKKKETPEEIGIENMSEEEYRKFVEEERKELERTEKILKNHKKGAILTVKDYFDKYLKNKNKEKKEDEENEKREKDKRGDEEEKK